MTLCMPLTTQHAWLSIALEKYRFQNYRLAEKIKIIWSYSILEQSGISYINAGQQLYKINTSYGDSDTTNQNYNYYIIDIEKSLRINTSHTQWKGANTKTNEVTLIDHYNHKHLHDLINDTIDKIVNKINHQKSCH